MKSNVIANVNNVNKCQYVNVMKIIISINVNGNNVISIIK
jgi:hypothetical protein